jgi:hypothetical protein
MEGFSRSFVEISFSNEVRNNPNDFERWLISFEYFQQQTFANLNIIIV